MKYLLVFTVVFVAFWIWRQNRRKDINETSRNCPSADAASNAPLPMLRCAACGVHLPAADALTGRQGSYCSLAHRSQKEG
jgi:uncharacterized protein